LALKGDLKDINLADIFQTLSMNQQEGTLSVVSGSRKMDLYFSKEGIRLLTTADKKYPRLGEILLKEKKITPVELDMALARQKMTGELLGQALIDMGIVSGEEINKCVRHQIEEEIYDVFSWKDASFEFIPGEPKGEFFDPARLGKSITFDVSGIIMEAARRVDEWEIIHKVIPSMQTVLRVRDPYVEVPKVGQKVGVQQEIVNEVVELVDGKKTVEKIVEGSPAGKFETCKILTELVQEKYLEVLGVKEMILVADQYANEGEVETAIKIYKEGLKNLPPSSVFRQKLAQLYESSGNQKDAAMEYAALADALVEEGSDEDAYSLYQKALELAPKNIQLHEKLLNFNILKGNKEEAIKEGLFVARNFWRTNKLQEAKQTLDKLVEIAPDNLEIRQMLINISLDLEDNAEAVKHYEFLAQYYSRTDDKESLIEIYRKILAIDKDRADIRAKLEKVLGKAAKMTEKKSRKTLIIGVVVLVIVAALGTAFWYYNQLAKAEMKSYEAKLERFSMQDATQIENLKTGLDNLTKEFNHLKRMFETVSKKYKFALLSDIGGWRQKCEMMLERGAEIVRRVEHKIRQEIEKKQREVAELIEKAEKMEREGNLEEAIGLYDGALKIAKEDAQAIQDIVKENVEKKIETLQRYLSDAKDLHKEADSAIKAGTMETAFNKMRELLDRFPHSPEAKRAVLPLIVETDPPGAKVLVNGVMQEGVTPLVFYRKPNSLVQLTLRFYGYKDEIVSMVDDRQARISVKLQKVPIWSLKLKDVRIISPVVTDGRRVFVTNVRGSIIALEAAEGRVLWEYKLQKRLSQFLYEVSSLNDDLLVVASTDKVLHLIEKERGSLFGQCNIDRDLSQRVLVVNKTVFLAAEDSVMVMSVDEKKIQKLKKVADKPLLKSPFLYDAKEQVLIVVAGDEVMALDATNLDDVWRYKLPVGTKVAIGKEMAISSDFIVVPTNVGTLLRLRRERNLPKVAQEGEEGEKVVSRELSPVRLGANITTGVCGRDKIVFVCTDDSIVHAVNVETGAEIWRYKLEKNVEAMPVTDNERLFVVDSGGTVYAFKVDNGALIWSDRLDSEVLASPVIIGQFIVIVTTEGSVYAHVR